MKRIGIGTEKWRERHAWDAAKIRMREGVEGIEVANGGCWKKGKRKERNGS